MGYYKDTGSLQSMASAEAILKKRMPEKVGILPVAELLFVAESMWVGQHDMKGHFHPSFRFVKAKRYNAKPHVLIELDGETLADINGRSKYYEGFSRCVDRKPEEGAWIEPTEFGVFLLLGTNDYMYIDQMANLSDIAPGFTPKNLQFMTYATAMAKARCGDEIPRCDVIVADEFHHCGAPEWGKGVQYVVENNPDAKIVGFSATPIRYSDKGRNMADEMFVGNIASSMELEEAWLDGVLPMPKYVIALYDAPKELGELKVSIEKVREKKKYSKFVKKYEELRRSLQDADGIDRIIAKHLRKRDSKVIVFCPNQKKLQEFMLLRREWFGRVNKEVHAYKTTSADPYGSRDFQEFKEDSSSALKVLYCINQLNEAVHVKGIDAIVMVRPTKSPVIFQQQLGRALTSGGNRTPLVFDLCNNFGSLGGIAGMQERMERAYEKKSEQGEKPIYEPKDFHVIDEIKDPRELAEELREALNPSTTIDEKISFLEEIAAQNGGQL